MLPDRCKPFNFVEPCANDFRILPINEFLRRLRLAGAAFILYAYFFPKYCGIVKTPD